MKLTRQARLSGAEAFGAVFARPKVSRDAYFRVLSRINGQAISRLGMAVSRKVCARATGRNRLKRIIRESFRKYRPLPGGLQPRDFVVLPSPAAAAVSNAELFQSLDHHWRQHGTPENEPARSIRPDTDQRSQTKGN